ncbi:hypothetical protein IJ732_04485 [bacterium]|nr:hypothetical protein [bacterium]
MTVNLNAINLTILPYNDLNKDKKNERGENFSETLKEEVKKNVEILEEKTPSYNLRGWEYVYKGLQSLNGSNTIDTYRTFMANSAYKRSKIL